jgi:hypothetical protein
MASVWTGKAVGEVPMGWIILHFISQRIKKVPSCYLVQESEFRDSWAGNGLKAVWTVPGIDFFSSSRMHGQKEKKACSQ